MRTLFDTLEQVIDAYPKDVRKFAIDGDAMSDRLYESLYDYYVLNGEMPYGTAKARDGDPVEWVEDRFYADVQDYMDVPVF
jgi:hypothetical protein